MIWRCQCFVIKNCLQMKFVPFVWNKHLDGILVGMIILSKILFYLSGVPSCNACAAFFRRTVACKKIYQCHYGHCCKLIHIKTRTMCKYCRYKRCLDVGMQVSEVQSDYKGHHIGRGEKSSNENVIFSFFCSDKNFS